MKVYLLNPPYMPHFERGARWQDTGRAGTLYYPIWLSYASALLELDHEIRLVDAPAWGWTTKEVLDDIGKFNPDILVTDSSFPSLENDSKVLNEIKSEFKDLLSILVGPPASQFSKEILARSGANIVARWEYDFTLKEIADVYDRKANFKDIKGISYKYDSTVIHNPDRPLSTSEDLDNIPFVSKVYKKHLNIKDYFLGTSLYPEVQIFTGRGCPNRCTFCSWPQTLMGRKYRYRSVANVLDELEWIEKNLKVKEIFLEDDTFTLSKERVMEFCKGYHERNLSVAWSCNARADTLDIGTMEQMKKAHCRLLVVGYESGSDVILGQIKKGITVSKIREFSKDAKKSGLLIHGDFIIGLPGESKETIQETKNLISEVKPDILQISVATPFPGTQFYDYCKQNGYLLTDNLSSYLDKEGHQIAIISYPGLDNVTMTQEVDKILKDYYFSLNYIPIALNQIFREKGLDELGRIWFSAKMFFQYAMRR